MVGGLVVRIGVVATAVVAVSGTASAHGGAGGGGGTPAGFAVVLGLPVVAGLVGGAIGVRSRRASHRIGDRDRSGVALGLLLVVLGSAFALAAATRSPPVSIAGGTVGGGAAVLVARRGTSGRSGRPGHAHLTLGAVLVHRAIEGAALGALYSTGAVVGLVGAAVLAAHTALETATIGGVYGARPVRAGGAVVVVQLGYVAGAAAGLAVAGTVPAAVRVPALALAGGALLGTGAIETGRAVRSGGPRGTRRGHEPRGGSEADRDAMLRR